MKCRRSLLIAPRAQEDGVVGEDLLAAQHGGDGLVALEQSKKQKNR
jgi:hypothetical protein